MNSDPSQSSDDTSTLLSDSSLSSMLFIVLKDEKKRKWTPKQRHMLSKQAFLDGLKEFLATNNSLYVVFEDPDLKESVELDDVNQIPNKALLTVYEEVLWTGNWIVKPNTAIFGGSFPEHPLNEAVQKDCMRLDGHKHKNLVEDSKELAASVPYCFGFVVNADHSWTTFSHGRQEGVWNGMTAYTKEMK